MYICSTTLTEAAWVSLPSFTQDSSLKTLEAAYFSMQSGIILLNDIFIISRAWKICKNQNIQLNFLSNCTKLIFKVDSYNNRCYVTVMLISITYSFNIVQSRIKIFLMRFVIYAPIVIFDEWCDEHFHKLLLVFRRAAFCFLKIEGMKI